MPPQMGAWQPGRLLYNVFSALISASLRLCGEDHPPMTTVFIVSAPSGSGKSTLVSHLLATVGGLMFSVSYTTRSPRGQEVDGESYHFVSREVFEGMLAREEFLEWAQVFDANGDYYGTHRRVLEEAREHHLDLVL